ncbi:hypothetical protein GCM10010442_58420 [Kitasatospora kifunensis]
MRLTDISHRSGLPLSTVHRVCGELERWGGLEKRTDGSWCIGDRLWEVGILAERYAALREAAAPFLGDLHAQTRQNVTLAVLDDLRVRYVDVIRGSQSPSVEVRPGGTLPVHATSAGKLLLAHAPREDQRAVAEQGLARYTPYTITAPGQLLRELCLVRRGEVAYSREELQLGTASVAAPVRGTGGEVIAALTVAFRVMRGGEKFELLVRRHAEALSEQLA